MSVTGANVNSIQDESAMLLGRRLHDHSELDGPEGFCIWYYALTLYFGKYTKYLGKKCLGHYISGIHQVSGDKFLGIYILAYTKYLRKLGTLYLNIHQVPRKCMFGTLYFRHTPSM